MSFSWHTLKDLPRFVAVPAPDSEQQIARITYMERNIGLPVKAAAICLLVYYLFFGNWLGDFGGVGDSMTANVSPQEVVLEVIRR